MELSDSDSAKGNSNVFQVGEFQEFQLDPGIEFRTHRWVTRWQVL